MSENMNIIDSNIGIIDSNKGNETTKATQNEKEI